MKQKNMSNKRCINEKVFIRRENKSGIRTKSTIKEREKGEKGRKQVSKAVTKSTKSRLTKVKYLTNIFYLNSSIFYIGQIFGKIFHTTHLSSCAMHIYHALKVTCSIIRQHSTHSYIHTSAFALSGFSLRSQFHDPVTTYTACILPLGSAGITVMNECNAPQEGQMLHLLK